MSINSRQPPGPLPAGTQVGQTILGVDWARHASDSMSFPWLARYVTTGLRPRHIVLFSSVLVLLHLGRDPETPA